MSKFRKMSTDISHSSPQMLTETINPTDMVQKWVKPTKTRAGITSGTQLPKRLPRAVKSKNTLPICKGKQDTTNCRIPEKQLPYCKPGKTKTKSNLPCKQVDLVVTHQKKTIHDLIPPQYRINPPTPKKDTFYPVPPGTSHAVLWNLFKTDIVPITNFKFMRYLRKEFSGYEYSEYKARRDDRLEDEREKLWVNSWKKKDESSLGIQFLDRDRSAILENERLYKKIKEKLDEHPVTKNAIPKLRCRPIRLIEPFAAEAEMYYRNLDKLPNEEKEKFVIPLTSMKREATDEYYPEGYPIKSEFYSSIPEESLESRKPKPLPKQPSLTYVLHVLPEDLTPKFERVEEFERKVEKVFEKRHELIPEPVAKCPAIVEILDLNDTDYGQGHGHLQGDIQPASEADDQEVAAIEEDEHLKMPMLTTAAQQSESTAGPVEITFDKAKEILKTMKRKALAADENLKARMMELRMNKAIED